MEIGNYVDHIGSAIDDLQYIINFFAKINNLSIDYEYEIGDNFDRIMQSCEQMEVYCRALRDKLNELD